MSESQLKSAIETLLLLTNIWKICNMCMNEEETVKIKSWSKYRE